MLEDWDRHNKDPIVSTLYLVSLARHFGEAACDICLQQNQSAIRKYLQGESSESEMKSTSKQIPTQLLQYRALLVHVFMFWLGRLLTSPSL